MSNVNTVLGPLDTTALGFTLMHERIITGAGGLFQNYPELFGPNIMKRIISSLKKAKEGGIDTIVDATTFDLGRNVNLLAEASRHRGFNITACTGWWLDIPRDLSGVTANQLAQLFIKDCELGIAGTSAKAGIIKAGSDREGANPRLKRPFYRQWYVHTSR